MDNYVTLIGAEDVRRAANTMSDAARSMNSAAGTIDSALRDHRIFLDEWLIRFKDVVETIGSWEHAR